MSLFLAGLGSTLALAIVYAVLTFSIELDNIGIEIKRKSEYTLEDMLAEIDELDRPDRTRTRGFYFRIKS